MKRGLIAFYKYPPSPTSPPTIFINIRINIRPRHTSQTGQKAFPDAPQPLKRVLQDYPFHTQTMRMPPPPLILYFAKTPDFMFPVRKKEFPNWIFIFPRQPLFRAQRIFGGLYLGSDMRGNLTCVKTRKEMDS